MKDKDQKFLEALYESMEDEDLFKINKAFRGGVLSKWTDENDNLHRSGGPALVHTVKGVVIWEQWHRNGRLHRLDGPALIRRDAQGNTTREMWIVDGKVHRLDGPAVTSTVDGVLQRQWWIGDTRLSIDEFNNHPLVKAHKLKEKLKSGSTSEEEGVMADMFA